jgi:hypothetical protein
MNQNDVSSSQNRAIPAHAPAKHALRIPDVKKAVRQILQGFMPF